MTNTLIDTLITEKDAARMLGLHPDTLKARRHKDHGPRHVNIGAGRKPVIRYRPSDVLAYIDDCISTRSSTEALNG